MSEMVQRAADMSGGIGMSSGQEERSGHPSAPWGKELVFPSIWCVQWMGPLQGRWGRRLLNILPQPGPRYWRGLGLQLLGFGPWCPFLP